MSTKRRAAQPAQTRAARPKKPKKTVGQWIRRLSFVALIGALMAGLAGFATFGVLYNVIDIPDPNAEFQTQTTFVYYADGKDELGKFATQNRDSIPLSEIPETMQNAVIAAENRTFWTDKGIDPKGILRAAFSNVQGNATQGASTITQQYVKILYLTQERTLKRKIKEAILSLKIQRQLSKKEILEGYLNTIYFGRGAYGVQAAAQAYFGVDAKKLNLRQCATLASVINNPSYFDPSGGKDNRQALLERYRYVLDGMYQLDSIDGPKAATAQKRLPKFPKIAAESTYGGQKGHVLTLVRNELLDLGFTDQQIDGGGLRVTTTFTRKAMDAAQAGVAEVRPDLGKENSQLHVGVASVDVKTGALLGVYGGQDYLDSQINWAATGGMIGSTAKGFTVAAAIKAGFELRDSFDGNSPWAYPGDSNLEVVNEGGGTGTDYGSAVSMLTATEESINTAFMDMSYSMGEGLSGPEQIYDTARDLGVPGDKANGRYPGIPMTSPDFYPDDALITLGKARVSPINMANAYATIANGGNRSNVHVVNTVVDDKGEVLYDRSKVTSAKPHRVLDEDIAADTSYALQGVVTSGTGRGALALGRPAAGKTGTATKEAGGDEVRVSSSWFVGYTPQVATAVMYVRGDGDDFIDEGWLPDANGMLGYFGANYPNRTWTAVMQGISEGTDVESFPPPAWVTGEAPSAGHNAYVPPAPPPAPEPKKNNGGGTVVVPKPGTKTKEPKPQPEPTLAPQPTFTPLPTEAPPPPEPTPEPPPATAPPPSAPAPEAPVTTPAG